ncbi:MAG: BolA family transcriptional regulator [Bradyrhizobium sp.]|nr:MAG: BolA family transcriptional regulator [Bradyrhizobium sp.]
MTRQERIAAAINRALNPSALELVDESDRHMGHAGARPGGETHYRLYIVADAFASKSRVERHRMVNALLAEEFASGLHALALTAAAPGEG